MAPIEALQPLGRREQERAHYATKAQLTKAYLELNDCRLRGAHAEDKSASAVLPQGVFLSGKDVEADATLLRSLGVTHVLQVIQLTCPRIHRGRCSCMR